MRKKLVAANWKMHGDLRTNEGLLAGVANGLDGVSCDVVICPPYPYLAQGASVLKGTSVSLGAQNVSEHTSGAFTGEVSVSMLVDVGCRYVLIGHSERRALFGESDQVVATKFELALSAGLIPVLCVGETAAERKAGDTLAVVSRQIRSVMDRVGVLAIGSGVVAYEPVWAIGTGLTASPDQAQEVHAAIRALVAGADPLVAQKLRILYGGSVKPQTASELFAQEDVDGGLIGGASLVVGDFLAICQAAV